MMSEIDARAKGKDLIQKITYEVDAVLEEDEEYAPEAVKKIQELCKQLDALMPDWMLQLQQEYEAFWK